MTGRPDIIGPADIIFRYADKGLIKAKNGSVFICPLSGGQMRFLHKLYGRNHLNSRVELENIFGFALPNDYLCIMNGWNGATLFDNTFSLFGRVTQINRGLTLEDSQPVSLETALQTSLVADDPSYPWRPYGSVSGYEKLFRLELDALGRARMQLENKLVRVADSVRELTRDLVEFLAGQTDENGYLDRTQRSMDAELLRFMEYDERGPKGNR